jgi:hypothetical protein
VESLGGAMHPKSVHESKGSLGCKFALEVVVLTLGSVLAISAALPHYSIGGSKHYITCDDNGGERVKEAGRGEEGQVKLASGASLRLEKAEAGERYASCTKIHTGTINLEPDITSYSDHLEYHRRPSTPSSPQTRFPQ